MRERFGSYAYSYLGYDITVDEFIDRTVSSAELWKTAWRNYMDRIRINFSVEILMMKNLMGLCERTSESTCSKAAGDHYEFLNETGNIDRRHF